MRKLTCSLLLFTSLVFGSGELSNRRAPGFALPTPDYRRWYDLQDFRGKVLIIEIMSTSCPHCMLTSTTLEKVRDRYGDKVGILSVVLPPDNQETVSKYMQTNKITVPIVADMGQMTISYINAKPGQSHLDVPHLFLIDKQGMIRNDWEYNDSSRPVFEGPGLFPEIEKLFR
ncbi:MAG TPA: TlpA disulfide reductase family protein [Bryobacteraceae bacterium]|nr:TlpA disulfide reductase family protein [Bryobacteraceae bacterium]